MGWAIKMASRTYNITVASGDGIGPEITPEAIKILDVVGEKRGSSFNYRFAKIGGVAYDEATAGMSPEERKAIEGWDDVDKRNLVLPQETLDLMDLARDTGGAILLGSVGRSDLPKRVAELALLGMRRRYGVVNNRPFIIDPILADNSILFRDPVEIPGFEIRSPKESLFNGYSGGTLDRNGHWTMKPAVRSNIEKMIRDAFEIAIMSRKKIMCASKYNILVSEKMISDVFEEVAKEYMERALLSPATDWAKNDSVTLGAIMGYGLDTRTEIVREGRFPTGQLIIDNAGMQIAAHPERYANTIVIADAMFGEFLQAIVDVVSGSKPVNKEALKEIKEKGIHRTLIRELCGGLYFGDRHESQEFAYDTLSYERGTIEDLATVANRANIGLGLGSVDSLEVEGVPTFGFWARVMDEHAETNDYNLRHLGVRQGVETLLTDPRALGTVIASNVVGDIYTDLAAAVVGKSLGIMPSSAVNAEGFGIYEQIAGTAPDIAGKGSANPIAEIRSAAMMLEDFGDREGAEMINRAITKALETARTKDIMEQGYQQVSTKEMGNLIAHHIREGA